MKPIEIRETSNGKYTVHVDGPTARAYGAKRRKKPLDGHVRQDGAMLAIDDQQPALECEWDRAVSLAHQIGRYMMGFGDLVFAYTTYPAGKEG